MSAASDAETVSSPAKYVDALPVYRTPRARANAIARPDMRRSPARALGLASTHSHASAAPIPNRQAISTCQPTPAAYTGLANSAPDPNAQADTIVRAIPMTTARGIGGG